MRWLLVAAGFLTLFFGAFLDSSRGPLLAILKNQWGVSYETLGWFLFASSLSGFPAVLALIRLKQRFSLNRIISVLVVLSFGSFLLLPWVHRPSVLILFGILLGIVISSLGSLSNLWLIHGVPLAKRSQFLCGLHLMYGVGAFFSPLAFKWVEENALAYYSAFWVSVPFGLGLIYLIQKQMRESVIDVTPQSHEIKFGLLDFLIVATFSTYVAGEVMTSMWMPTLLMKAYGFSFEKAANYSSCFFGLLVLTRALCFMHLRQNWSLFILVGSLFLSLVCLWIGLTGEIAVLFPLVGILGPFYPLMMGFLNENFQHRVSHLTLWVNAGVQVTLALAHLGLGEVAQRTEVRASYALPGMFLGLTLVLFFLVWKQSKASKMPVAR